MPGVAGFFLGAVGYGGAVSGALAAGYAAGATFAASTLGSIAVRLVTTVAISALSAALQKKPDQGGGLTLNATMRGEQNPETIILGLTATGGQAICPPYSHGASNRYLTQVIELCSAPGATLEGLIMGGERVEIGTEAHADYGLPILGDYDGLAWIKYYDGSQTAADPMMVEKYGSHPDRPWTADMIGTGLCYAIVTFQYDQERLAQAPALRFEMGGIPLYDIRKDSTAGGSGTHRLDDPATWEPSLNPIVQIWNIWRGIELPGDEIWGGGLDPDEAMPQANWVAQMNKCDTSVALSGGGSEPMYRAGIEAALTDAPASVAEELLKAASAQIADMGGYWRILAGAPDMPVYACTDDDIIVSREQEYHPFPGLAETYNAVTAQHPDPASLWETRDAPPRTNAEWEAADTFGRRTANLQLPAVPWSNQVQRLMLAYIEDERRMRRHIFSLPPDAGAVELLDTIDYSSVRNGYDGKDFSVYEIAEDLLTGIRKFSLRERDPADYDWSPSYELPTAPAVTISSPPPAPVTGFAAAGFTILDDGSNPRRPALQLTWSGDQLADGLRWEIRLASLPAAVQTGSTLDLASGQAIISEGILPGAAYEVRARLIAAYPTGWTGWVSATTPDVRPGLSDLDDEVGDAINAAAGSAAADVVAAEAARDAALLAQTAAETAEANAEAAEGLAASAASTAATHAANADSYREAAALSATSAGAAQAASETAQAAAETAQAEAETALASAEAAAVSASDSATLAASSETAALGAAVRGVSILRPPAEAWTAAGTSTHSSLLKPAVNHGVFVDDDADFGDAYEFTDGANRIIGQALGYGYDPARIYEVTYRFKVVSAGDVNVRYGVTTQTGLTVVNGNVQSAGEVIQAADGVIERRVQFAITPSALSNPDATVTIPGASSAANQAWFHIRQNSTVTSGRLRVASIAVRDVTEAIAAAGSASAAASSATAAGVSATEAGESADAAQTSRLAAETAQGAAETAQSSAASSATTAAGHASNAATSETSAANSATAAGDSAGAASTSASAAGSSATAAGNSASTAASHASDAANSATSAGNSASAASTSASTAATEAGNAGTSASAAENSALVAEARATDAADHAADASSSASASAASASAASASATSASNSAAAASSARIAAETARTGAEAAQSAAVTAADDADGFAASAQRSSDLAAYRAVGNLVSNPAADDLGDWPIGSQYSPTVVTHGQSEPSSDKSIRVTVEGGSGFAIAVSDPVVVESVAGRTYRVAAMIRSSVAGLMVGGSIYATQDGASPATYFPGAPVTTATTTGFVLYEWEIEIPGGAAKNEISVRLYATGSGGAWFELTDVIMEDVTTLAATIEARDAASASETAAAASASAAQTARTAAETAQAAAGVSASNAATSETNAAGSASSASGFATNAAASATSAASSAGTAAGHAGDASTDADAAAASASAAAGHAGTASTKADEASTSAAAALTSRTAAETAAGNASSSATSAASSATTAAGHATNAASFASNASASADGAADDAAAASTSAGNASSSASASAASAGTASTKASEASASASAALTSQTNAASSAGAAATSAGAASGFADDAEGFSVSAQQYSLVSARMLAGGMIGNPSFTAWSGASPDGIVFSASQGSLAKDSANAKYENAILMTTAASPSTPAPYILTASRYGANFRIYPADVEQVLVTLEVELVSGDWSGFFAKVRWIGPSNYAVDVPLDQGQLVATTGMIQKVEFYVDRPANFVQGGAVDDVDIILYATSALGNGYSQKSVRVHRMDVQNVLSESSAGFLAFARNTVQGIVNGFVWTLGEDDVLSLVQVSDGVTEPTTSAKIKSDLIVLDGDTTVLGDFRVEGDNIFGATLKREFESLIDYIGPAQITSSGSGGAASWAEVDVDFLPIDTGGGVSHISTYVSILCYPGNDYKGRLSVSASSTDDGTTWTGRGSHSAFIYPGAEDEPLSITFGPFPISTSAVLDAPEDWQSVKLTFTLWDYGGGVNHLDELRVARTYVQHVQTVRFDT